MVGGCKSRVWGLARFNPDEATKHLCFVDSWPKMSS